MPRLCVDIPNRKVLKFKKLNLFLTKNNRDNLFFIHNKLTKRLGCESQFIMFCIYALNLATNFLRDP